MTIVVRDNSSQQSLTAFLQDSSTRTFTARVSDSEETSCVDSESVMASGLQSFGDVDLSGADSTFCEAYELGSSDSQIAFGCFLAKLLSLPETTDARDLWDMFNQDYIDVETDILTAIVADFVSDTSNRSDVGFDAFRYNLSLATLSAYGKSTYDVLPFHDIIQDTSVRERQTFAEIVALLQSTSTSADEFQTQVLTLQDDFEYMEGLLDIVLDDTAFTFEIPDGLFSTDTDITVVTKEAQLFMASMKFTLVTLSTFEAYDYGVDPDKVVNSTGDDFDVEVLVADLNGTGETINTVTVDSTAFLTASDLSLITAAKERFDDGVGYAISGFETLDSGEASELLDDSLEDVNFTTVITLFEELQTSSASDVMVPLSITDGSVSLNLYNFFNNPPSAADVTSTDPFVVENNCSGCTIKIRMVESYFQDLLDGIAEF